MPIILQSISTLICILIDAITSYASHGIVQSRHKVSGIIAGNTLTILPIQFQLYLIMACGMIPSAIKRYNNFPAGPYTPHGSVRIMSFSAYRPVFEVYSPCGRSCDRTTHSARKISPCGRSCDRTTHSARKIPVSFKVFP
jgi:hypothetical protein